MSGAHRETVQKQIHQDWANREYIEVITASIKRITDFLNSFGKNLHAIINLRIALISILIKCEINTLIHRTLLIHLVYKIHFKSKSL